MDAPPPPEEDAPPPPPEEAPPPPPDDTPPPPPDDDELPPPPPPLPPPPPPDDNGDDPPPPPPPADEDSMQQQDPQQQYASYEEYAAAYAAYIKAYADAGYDVSQFGQEGAEGAEGSTASGTRPEWLEEIVNAEKGRSRSRSPERSSDAAGAAGSGQGGWDARWGYQNPVWRGPQGGVKRGNQRYGHVPPPGPRKGIFLQRCPAFQGGKGKCKRGHRCTFAHGDAELAPKEFRQMRRREVEAAQMRRQGEMGANDDGGPVRQREIQDEGDGPAYLDFAALQEQAQAAAAAASLSSTGDDRLAGGVAAAAVAGSGSGNGSGMLEAMYRQDGTPLDFSSREAKVNTAHAPRLSTPV